MLSESASRIFLRPGQTMNMEKDIFFEVFLRTGDPLCWLLARRKTKPDQTGENSGRRDTKTPPPGI